MADMPISHAESAAVQHQQPKKPDYAASTTTTLGTKGAPSRMPTYISSGSVEREPKLPQQLLSRRPSIDLDDYFVCSNSMTDLRVSSADCTRLRGN